MLEVNHPEVVKKIIKLQNFASITHYVSVKDDIQQGLLVKLTTNYQFPFIVYQVVTNTKKKIANATTQFIQYLKESL